MVFNLNNYSLEFVIITDESCHACNKHDIKMSSEAKNNNGM